MAAFKAFAGGLTRKHFRAGLIIGLILVILFICSRPFTPRFRSDLIFGRGLWYFNRNQYATAQEYFDQAIAINPQNAPAYYNRGRIYQITGDYAAALDDFNRVIELYPDYPDPYLDRALIYLALADYQAACSDLTVVIESKPYIAPAYYYRAQAAEGLHDDQAALADYRQFLNLYGLDDTLRETAQQRLDELLTRK